MNKKDFIDKLFITNNSKETKKLGKSLARVLKKGDLVCLYGDLGSGKTTFVQGLAEGLGIKQKIISPTFIIIKNYESPLRSALQNFEGQARVMNFYHIDLYRVENEKDLESLGIEEILNDSENIVVIEWAENLKEFLPKKRIDLKFAYESENKRKITFALSL